MEAIVGFLPGEVPDRVDALADPDNLALPSRRPDSKD